MDFNQASFLPEAEQYHEIAAHFVPGYQSLYEIARCYLSLHLPKVADILIVGAGGGMEIKILSRFSQQWSFAAVDPSSRMLDVAKFWTERSNALNRVQFTEGFVSDLPSSQVFDAATCVLVMHFLPDETEKLKLLKDIALRLKTGGILILADLAVPKETEEFEVFRQLYSTHAEQQGEPEVRIKDILTVLENFVHPVSNVRESELVKLAGFNTPTMFFSSIWFKAWFALKE
ncbi:class I SAM-dependent methyltransferase [Fischerella sp. PCC 9605]|uniref:class I SAM-dependent methyltransferase n=1 Tax=Fischerella sp. PCC 9605 TaxID=1173024 RepID=UPI00047AF32A|nr:class I SAM-dependent methyltransferase [Fischerella sp. PCC 9605]